MNEILNGILEAINTHGLALVISGIVIFLLFNAGNILIEYLRNKLDVKKHDDLVDKRGRVGAAIQELLDKLVLQTHADRAYVSEFHNTAVSIAGLPFLYTSCNYEALGEGAASAALARQNLSMQLYHKLMEAITKHPFVILDVNHRDESVESQVGYETLAQRGVSVAVRVKITDNNKRAIGFVGLDYGNPVDKTALERYIPMTREAAVKLGALLSVNGKDKKD